MDASKLAPAAIEWLQKPITEPRDFVRATWRGTTAVNPRTGNELGISFDTREGIERFVLPIESALQLVASVLDAVAPHVQIEARVCRHELRPDLYPLEPHTSPSGNPEAETAQATGIAQREPPPVAEAARQEAA